MHPKCVEDDAEVLQVSGLGGAIYDYVIEKHKHESAQKGAEHVVHQSLKSRRCVGKAERHDQELKMAMVSAKHRLSEEASPIKLVKKLIDDRNRNRAWYRVFILSRIL